jgi:hypothetical protein
LEPVGELAGNAVFAVEAEVENEHAALLWREGCGLGGLAVERVQILALDDVGTERKQRLSIVCVEHLD